MKRPWPCSGTTSGDGLTEEGFSMQPDSPAIMAAAMNAVDRSLADKRDTARNAGNLNDGPVDENVIVIGNLPERRTTFPMPQYSPAP